MKATKFMVPFDAQSNSKNFLLTNCTPSQIFLLGQSRHNEYLAEKKVSEFLFIFNIRPPIKTIKNQTPLNSAKE
jgi:hypothetical protein